MGHDVIAMRQGGEAGFTEDVAHLRRSAGNPLNDAIYKVLNAMPHYCGVSGCGTAQIFTNDQIGKALALIPFDDDYDKEREFLRHCWAVRCDIEITFS